MPSEDTHVIQVTNVSPGVTKDQLKNLFSFIGKVEDIKLYPELEAIDVSTRVCYVKFKESEDVGVALHLTNTVFVDRALIVVPVPDDKIPDEMSALGLASTEDGANPSNMYQGLTQYPVLPANTELSKVEEIRRTVYVSNIDCTVTPEILMQFFTQAGEIKYMRMAGDENLSLRNAFVEYTDQNSVVKALGLNGHILVGQELMITPSNSAIVKPPILPGISATSKEIEEAMKKVNEAESLISAVVDPLTNGNKRSRSRHRSRSRRSRSRKRSRSKRSRSRRRSRSRSKRSRYRSRSRHRSRSRRSHKRYRRSRSRRSRSRKSRTRRSRSRDRKPRDRKSRSPRKRSRSKERSAIDLESKSYAKDVSSSNKYEREGSINSDERKSKLPKKEAKRKSRSRSSSNGRSKKPKKSHRDSDRAHEKEKKSRKEDKGGQKHRGDRDADASFDKESSLSKAKKKSRSDRYKSPEKESSRVEEGKCHRTDSGSEDGCPTKNVLDKDDVDCAQMDMDVDSD